MSAHIDSPHLKKSKHEAPQNPEIESPIPSNKSQQLSSPSPSPSFQSPSHPQKSDQPPQKAHRTSTQVSYQSLTTTLETALKKMKNQKNMDRSMNMNKTMILLNRFDQHERKKEKDLEEKRVLEEQRKYLGIKDKPDINPNSRRIAEETSHQPIYHRFEKILEDRKGRIQKNQQEKKQKEEEEYQQFLKEYEAHVKMHTQDCRDSQTFFHDMMTWKQKLDKQREEKSKMQKQKEVEGLTFQPELNKKSMKIIGHLKRVPVQDRDHHRNYNLQENPNRPKPLKRKQQP